MANGGRKLITVTRETTVRSVQNQDREDEDEDEDEDEEPQQVHLGGSCRT